MHKIDGAGHVDGQFVTEDAASGRPPTLVTADWLNAVQGELVAVLQSAGIEPDKANNTQMATAITALLQAHKNEDDPHKEYFKNSNFDLKKQEILNEIYKDFIPNAGRFATGSDQRKKYLHFRLPCSVNSDYMNFNLRATGYEYGAGKLIEAQFVGYCYPPYGTVINVDVAGTHSPRVYVGSDKYVYIRLSMTDSYYMSVLVGSYFVTVGRLINRYELVPNLTDLEEL